MTTVLLCKVLLFTGGRVGLVYLIRLIWWFWRSGGGEGTRSVWGRGVEGKG